MTAAVDKLIATRAAIEAAVRAAGLREEGKDGLCMMSPFDL